MHGDVSPIHINKPLDTSLQDVSENALASQTSFIATLARRSLSSSSLWYTDHVVDDWKEGGLTTGGGTYSIVDALLRDGHNQQHQRQHQSPHESPVEKTNIQAALSLSENVLPCKTSVSQGWGAVGASTVPGGGADNHNIEKELKDQFMLRPLPLSPNSRGAPGSPSVADLATPVRVPDALDCGNNRSGSCSDSGISGGAVGEISISPAAPQAQPQPPSLVSISPLKLVPESCASLRDSGIASCLDAEAAVDSDAVVLCERNETARFDERTGGTAADSGVVTRKPPEDSDIRHDGGVGGRGCGYFSESGLDSTATELDKEEKGRREADTSLKGLKWTTAGGQRRCLVRQIKLIDIEIERMERMLPKSASGARPSSAVALIKETARLKELRSRHKAALQELQRHPLERREPFSPKSPQDDTLSTTLATSQSIKSGGGFQKRHHRGGAKQKSKPLENDLGNRFSASGGDVRMTAKPFTRVKDEVKVSTTASSYTTTRTSTTVATDDDDVHSSKVISGRGLGLNRREVIKRRTAQTAPARPTRPSTIPQASWRVTKKKRETTATRSSRGSLNAERMAAVYLRNASSCQRKASIDDATPGSLGFHHGSLKVGRTGADSVISRCSSRAKRSAADREKKVVASAGCAAWLGVGKKHGPCPRATTEPSSKLSSTARDTSGCGTSGGDGVVRKRRSYCRGQQPIYHLCAPTFQDSMCCDDPKTLCPLSDHLWSSSAVKTLPPFFHEKSVKGPRGVLNENKHHRCTTCCCSPVPKVGDCRYAASIGRCCHSSDLYSLNISTCSRDDYKIKPCCCCRSTSYRPRATSPDASSCSVGVCSQAPCHDASLQGELFLLNNTGRFTVQKEQKGGSVWQRLVSESEWHKSPERHPATCNSVADGADSTVNSDLKCKPRCTEKSDLLERIRKCLSELGEHRITQ